MVCEESPELLKLASSAAESSFRELDDAFLQTQTRIWLGEVLQIRLDEQLIISELLADGELLFQVSKVVWKLLLTRHMELRHIKAYKSPFASKKNSGRYSPYSNVDSFLKICKIVGLTGIDLFSPSDVVERRNTRRVCMCIRSFSKKSRSLNINVPDFDIVTCMVTMPKDLVGCLRRNIELSHSILADSSSYYLQKHAGGKSRQDCSVTHSTRDYETYSDQPDDNPTHQFDDTHSDDLYDYTSEINYNLSSPMVRNVLLSEDLGQLDTQNQQRKEISDDEFDLLCLVESFQCQCSENTEHDCKLNWSTSPSSMDVKVHGNWIMNRDYFEDDLLSNKSSAIGTPMYDKTPITSDTSSKAKYRKYTDLCHEENIAPNLHQSPSSHSSDSTPLSVENCRCFEIGDNVEVLHVAGRSFLSREAWNLRHQFDAENNFQNVESLKLHDYMNDHYDTIKEYESQEVMKCKEVAYGVASDARYSYFVKEFEETEHSLYSSDFNFCKTNSSDRAASESNDISSTPLKKFLAHEDRKCQVETCLDNTSCNQSEALLSSQTYSLPEFCRWDQKGKCAMASSRAEVNKSSSCLKDGTTPCKKEASQSMSKAMLSFVLNKEDVVSAVVVKLGTCNKELKNDFQALASNAQGVDDSKKFLANGDDANDFHDISVTTQDIGGSIGGRGQRVQDAIINDIIVPASCDENVSHSGSCVRNQSSELESDVDHQACQYGLDPVYHSEHTREVHNKEEIKPEDESVHSIENLVETEEGSKEIRKGKPQKKLLLKSVLGGAAAVGLLFMFLHLRRNDGEKAAQPSKASNHKGKEKIQKYSPRKIQRTTTTEGVYPADKLKYK